MDILLTSFVLDSHTGAELHLRDLARAFKSRGHRVRIYALVQGVLARSMREEGFEVLRKLGGGDTPPDIIHAQHQPALLRAMLQYPRTPAIQVIHDAVAPFDAPLLSPRVLHYVAVDKRCANRLHQAGNDPDICTTILNFADLDRFRPRGPLPETPRTALVFSNYAKATAEDEALVAACERQGLKVDFLGSATGGGSTAPECILPNYDVVFAKARAAIEAMAVGCAVVLCDFSGLGRLVTPADFDKFRLWNFGAGLLTRPITVEDVESELKRYSAPAAALVSGRVRQEANLDVAALQWLELYQQLIRVPQDHTSFHDARLLKHHARRWALPTAAAQLQLRTRRLKESSGRTASLYRLGRGVWRALGSPGEMR